MSQHTKDRISTSIFLILIMSLAFITTEALLLKILYSVFAGLAISEWLHRIHYTSFCFTWHIWATIFCGAMCFYVLSPSQIAIATISALIYDSFALFGGKLLGKKIIPFSPFPCTSPKKTWEGLIIGLTASIGICFLLGSLWPSLFLLSPAYYIIAAPCAALGDYLCSHYKRSLDIIDCGTRFTTPLLPGHGGFIDRFLSHFTVAIAFAFAHITALF